MTTESATVTTSTMEKPMISSQLSADAESFVPNRPSFGGPSDSAPAPGPGPVPQGLPSYVTNCYPFVSTATESTAPPIRANVPTPSMPWSGQNRPQTPIPGYNYQRWPNPPTGGGYAFSGTRPPAPGHTPLRTQGFRQPFAPASVTQHHPALGAPLMPYLPPPAAQAAPPVSNAAQPFVGFSYGPVPQQQPQTATWSQPAPAQFPPAQYGTALHYTQHWSPPQDSTPGFTERKSKKRKETSNMVSIGIQNESGTLRADSLPKKKNKPKTIILMDAANQTDFSEEIANLTLAEKPHALYVRRDPAVKRYQRYDAVSTTDSEEVDSDSGYSSPLHRRNQQNNGTHPVVAGGATVAYIPEPPSAPGYIASSGGLQDSYQRFSSIATIPSSLGASYSVTASSQVHPLLPPPAPPCTALGQSAAAMLTQSYDFRTDSALQRVSPTRCVRTEPEDDELTSGMRKKKKKVKPKRKKNRSLCADDMDVLSDEPGSEELRRAHSSSNVSRTSMDPLSVDTEGQLHFEDEDEFPDLLSAASALNPGALQSPTSLPVSTMAYASTKSYSDILKNNSQSPLSQESLHSGTDLHLMTSHDLNLITQAQMQQQALLKESKTARKRRKRREMANRAAEEELAEISLEQQVLKEIGIKGSLGSAPVGNQPSGKKSSQPISFNIADALEKQEEAKVLKQKQQQEQAVVKRLEKTPSNAVNPLDSTAPLQKRGKEREVPKQKKPSPLKKVILKEREEKKRWRLGDELPVEGTALLSPESDVGQSSGPETQLAPAERQVALEALQAAGMAVPQDSDLSQEASSRASSLNSVVEYETGTPISASAELSPISQTSPISMSPLSPASPMNSGLTSPINNSHTRDYKPGIALKIHSRRFREYCNQILDKDIDNSCTLLLQELVRFQDRLYHKDPLKAKSRRRIVLGLREVSKHLKLRKIKCVIISPNLEKIQAKGGLDEALNNILHMCQEQMVPFVFALGRRALGRACAKLVPVSVVGVFDYQGADDHFQRLLDLTERARMAYHEMVALLEKDNADSAAQRYPQLFAHMGHSRTPSACSAISFSSSILSEPISENYPHSEPETDSRGYEIVRAEQLEAASRDSQGDARGDTSGDDTTRAPSPSDVTEAAAGGDTDSSRGKKIVIESLDDIDEYEADIEDTNDTCTASNCNSQLSKSISSTHTSTNPSSSVTSSTESVGSGRDQAADDLQEDSDEGDQSDTVHDLPQIHIDSIHSSVVDLKAEILSQHSTATVESSKTVEAVVNGTAVSEQNGRGHRTADSAESGSNNTNPASTNTSPASKCARTLDKERIESWVAETQQQLETLRVGDGAAASNGLCNGSVEEDPAREDSPPVTADT